MPAEVQLVDRLSSHSLIHYRRFDDCPWIFIPSTPFSHTRRMDEARFTIIGARDTSTATKQICDANLLRFSILINSSS